MTIFRIVFSRQRLSKNEWQRGIQWQTLKFQVQIFLGGRVSKRLLLCEDQITTSLEKEKQDLWKTLFPALLFLSFNVTEEQNLLCLANPYGSGSLEEFATWVSFPRVPSNLEKLGTLLLLVYCDLWFVGCSRDFYPRYLVRRSRRCCSATISF